MTKIPLLKPRAPLFVEQWGSNFLKQNVDQFIMGCHNENDFHARKSGSFKSAERLEHMDVVQKYILHSTILSS